MLHIWGVRSDLLAAAATDVQKQGFGGAGDGEGLGGVDVLGCGRYQDSFGLQCSPQHMSRCCGKHAVSVLHTQQGTAAPVSQQAPLRSSGQRDLSVQWFGVLRCVPWELLLPWVPCLQ
jgi:hypothetical protein